MSLKIADEAISPRLRRGMVVWGLAVVSSLTSTGIVGLPPGQVWAQDDAAEQKEEAAEKEKPFGPQEFQKLLRESKYEEAAEKIDAAMKEDPTNNTWESLNTTLAMYLVRSKPEMATSRLGQQVERLLARDDLNASLASSLARATNYLVQADDQMEIAAKLATMDEVLAKLDENDFGSAAGTLISSKGRLLVQEERADEAKQMLDARLAELREQLGDSSSARSRFISMASTYQSTLGDEFAEASAEVLGEAETLAKEAIAGEDATAADFSGLYGLKMGVISRLTYSNPVEAKEHLDELEKARADLAERLGEDDSKRLSSYERTLKSYASRIESALAREALIGTKAPEIDAVAFVATDEVTMDDLKGKVVLIDFWAVWCGPCIATFPHLIEWHEEYSDRGLVILGATKFYNYAWDEEAGKASRSQDEVDAETELAMLEKFRESYDLHHGFFVSGKESDYSKQFQVSGIPQAVLIDKEGKIQMIKVGSGEANAKALHAKIEELLGQS